MAKPRVTNLHHLVYPSPEHPEQEWTERIYKGEHLCLTRMDWYTRKTVSKGFLTCLEVFIARNRNRATELKE